MYVGVINHTKQYLLSLFPLCEIAGTDQVFRLNWAANGRQGIAGPSDYSLFVGDLTEEVTDYMLQEAFRRYYPSVRSAKVSAVYRLTDLQVQNMH